MTRLKLKFMKLVLDFMMGIYTHKLDEYFNYNRAIALSNDIEDKLEEVKQ